MLKIQSVVLESESAPVEAVEAVQEASSRSSNSHSSHSSQEILQLQVQAESRRPVQEDEMRGTPKI